MIVDSGGVLGGSEDERRACFIVLRRDVVFQLVIILDLRQGVEVGDRSRTQ